ncbi:MAG: hypothetical protein K2X63_07390 [Burkholderiaceae bacterium]|jgi:hypothetical protein|nr:hypothetical protein [Burkholderiaceae bacterium]
MGAFVMPVYMVDFTPKTISAILSPHCLEGNEIELDVYNRNDVSNKLQAKGRRLKGTENLFRVVVDVPGISNEHDWNFTILRESADRSRPKK